MELSKNKICLNCLIKVEGDLRCGQCRTALYCSAECQAKHWKVHKNICKDSNIEDSLDKLFQKGCNSLEQGNYAKSEKLLKKYLNQSVGQNNDINNTIGVMQTLARALERQGKIKDSLQTLRDASILVNSSLGISNSSKFMINHMLAALLTKSGQFKEAESILEECLKNSEGLGDDSNRFLVLDALGCCYMNQDKLVLAEKMFVQCIVLSRGNKRDAVNVRKRLASVYFKMNRVDDGVSMLDKVLRTLKDIVGETHPEYLEVRSNLGISYIKQEKYEQALIHLEGVLDSQVKLLGHNISTLETMTNVAVCYNELNQLDKAIELLELSIQKRKELGGTEDSCEVINSRILIAKVIIKLGQHKEAKEIVEVSLERLISIYGERHFKVRDAMIGCIKCYHNLGEIDKADALARRFDALFH